MKPQQVAAAHERVAEFGRRVHGVHNAAEFARVLDELVPGLVANPFLPHWPHPKQLAGLAAAFGHDDNTGPFEMLFGGAAGGGKSNWVLTAAAIRAARWSGYRCLILRRTHAEMMKSGAVLSRALDWWLPRGVKWSADRRRFTFPGGAIVEFGYHAHPTDNAQYQGGEWHDVYFDELTHWPDADAFEWLQTRQRTNAGDALGRCTLATSNPGEAGHTWVKNRFIGGYDLATGERIEPTGFYLPSRIVDNPSLSQEAYEQTLEHVHPTRRAQLLDGDWNARPPGDYFRLEWFGPLLEPDVVLHEAVAVRWWDLAASTEKDAARTAGVRMVRMPHGVRIVTHATAFRAGPGARDARIHAQARTDGRGTVVGIEIEGGSGGMAQFEALAARLREDGFRVVGARPRAGGAELSDREKAALAINTPSDRAKEARADPVASCLERGHRRRGESPDVHAVDWGADANRPALEQRDGIRLVAGAWTQAYLDELEGFPAATLKDLVDATSGAWAWLQAHPAGAGRAPTLAEKEAPAAVSHDAHPELRPRDEDVDRTPRGRWRP